MDLTQTCRSALPVRLLAGLAFSVALGSCLPAAAEMMIQPAYNAAIVHGPMFMAMQVGNVGRDGKICGQPYENDRQKEQLQALQAAGRCGPVAAASSTTRSPASAGAGAANAAPASASPAASRALSYQPSAALRRSHYAELVTQTRSTDPAGAERMQQLFASTDVIAQLDQALRPSGLRADNVADAYAVWWITAWEAVHQRDMGLSPRMTQAVRQQAAARLLGTPGFLAATDAQKQQMAESLLMQAALIQASKDLYASDAAQLNALSMAVNQGAMALHPDLDLRHMTLGSDGFNRLAGAP